MNLALQRRALGALEEALDQPQETREAWIQDHHGADPELIEALRRLLRGDAAGSAAIPTEPPDAGPAVERAPPERIGPYRLTRLLGRGGMSAVWLGERDDGLFDQAVAVKLMSAGLFAGLMGGLFDRERRILARLKHPNIARLYDGGVEASGVPYFIMERVTGEAIDDFVRARNLDVRETVRLFLQVCAAVRHAHQNLVAHADIKPSNVLVDEGATAKLLDFGIAQIVEDKAAGGPVAFPVTPAYASPQRLAGEPPTPADDIYALGALLHDLLAGVTVADRARGRPSARLSDPDRAGAVRGDLDAIALKAMAADPAARYPSVDALTDDLERWLARRPVAARNPDWRMVLGRYGQRHPLGVAAGVAALFGLVAALIVTTGLYLQAQQARQRADARFAEVRGMAKYLLFDLYDGLDRTPQSLALRRDVARKGQTYLDRLSADANAPVEVRVEAIEGLARLASVQGSPGRPNLGQAALAGANFARASGLAARLAGEHPLRPGAWLAVAKVELERAPFLAQADGAIPAAEAALARAKAAIARAHTLAPSSDAVTGAQAQWLLRASELRQWQGRFGDSVAFGRRALAVLSARPARTVDERLRLSRAWDVVAESLYYAGPESAAEAPYRSALAVVEALARDRPGDPVVLRALARARWALGTTLVSIGKADEAMQVLSAAIHDAAQLVAFDAADEDARRMLRLTRTAHAQALAAARRFPEAIAALTAQVAERRTVWIRDPDSVEAARDLAIAIASLGDVQADAGQTQQACATYDQGVAAFDTLRRRGRLTGLDQEHGLRLLRARLKAVCGRS